MPGAIIPATLGALSLGRSICLPDDVEWIGLVTGLLDRMRRPYFWDTSTGDVDAVVDTANRIFYAWLDQLCGVGGAVQYRRDPTPGSYTLQVRASDADEWQDTEYNFIGEAAYRSFITSTIKDQNDVIIGTVSRDDGGFDPAFEQIQNDTYTIEMDSTLLKGDKGDTGEPGADGIDGTDGADGIDGTDGTDGADGIDGTDGTDGADGIDGHSILIDDPPLGILPPNGTPRIDVGESPNNASIIKFFNTRGQLIETLPTITGAPGTEASTAYSLTTDGDLVQQHTIPEGQPGADSVDAWNIVPPEPGETKHYALRIPSGGAIVPFPLMNTWIVKNITAEGLWPIDDQILTGETVTDKDGFEYTTGNFIGELQVGVKAPVDANFSWEKYTDETMTYDYSHVAFRQHTTSNLTGWGYLLVEFDVEYPAVEWDLIGEQLFTYSPNDWHIATSSDNPSASHFGGEWLSTDGGGFHPTDESGDVRHLSIAPRRSGHWNVTTIEVFWKNHTGTDDFTLFLWTKNNDTHNWGFHAVNTPTGASGSTVLTLNEDIEYLTISSHCYPHAASDWQIWKAIVSGTDL